MITKKVILKYNIMVPHQTDFVQKKEMLAGAQTEIFQGRFSKIRVLDNHFVKNIRNILSFSPRHF